MKKKRATFLRLSRTLSLSRIIFYADSLPHTDAQETECMVAGHGWRRARETRLDMAQDVRKHACPLVQVQV